VVQPRRKLVDFRKVKLAAGETLNVSFTLDADKLSFIGQDTKPVLESGLFDVWVAPSATAGEGSRFTLI
jgi:beta-glucosidase